MPDDTRGAPRIHFDAERAECDVRCGYEGNCTMTRRIADVTCRRCLVSLAADGVKAAHRLEELEPVHA